MTFILPLAADHMPDLAIQTEDLNRSFGELRAVDDLSLRVPRGSVFGFLGPNGAGKTTTIRLLLGLLAPSSGRAEILGHDVTTGANRIRDSAGALLEHTGLYERLTAEENLEFHGRLRRLAPDERCTRIVELLTHFGLAERRQDVVAQFSRGMRQKLALARALLHRPSLLFLDEPTAGLDPEAAASLREDIGSLSTEGGTTIFLTTHNLFEAEKVCDRVGIVRQGRLLASGPPDALHPPGMTLPLRIRGRFTPEALERIGATPEVARVSLQDGVLVVDRREEVRTGSVVRTIVEAGGEVEEVAEQRPSLEDAYLEIMGRPAGAER